MKIFLNGCKNFLNLPGEKYQIAFSGNERMIEGRPRGEAWWSDIDISPFKAMLKNRLLRCSLRIPRLSILFHRFKWQINRYIAKHATPLDLVYDKADLTRSTSKTLYPSSYLTRVSLVVLHLGKSWRNSDFSWFLTAKSWFYNFSKCWSNPDFLRGKIKLSSED